MVVEAVLVAVLPVAVLIQLVRLAVMVELWLAVLVPQEQTSMAQFMVQVDRDILVLMVLLVVAELLTLILTICERQENEKFQL